MKKPLILVAIALASLTSCEKKKCYYCTTTQTISGNPALSSVVSSTSVCDLKEDDARDYEKENSSTTTATVNGVQITTTKTTACQ